MLLTASTHSLVLAKEFEVLGEDVPTEKSSVALRVFSEKELIPEYYQPPKVAFYDVRPKIAGKNGDVLVIVYVLGHPDEYNWSDYHWSFMQVVDTKSEEIASNYMVLAFEPEHLTSTWQDWTGPPPMQFSTVPPSANATHTVTASDPGWWSWELKLDSSMDGILWDKVWHPH